MNKPPKCVVIESPFRGRDAEEQRANEAYRDKCLYDSLLRGEAPFMSHGLYPRVLNDALERERRLGIEGQKAWIAKADLVVIYTDKGISEGMQEGIDYANTLGIPIQLRRLFHDDST